MFLTDNGVLSNVVHASADKVVLIDSKVDRHMQMSKEQLEHTQQQRDDIQASADMIIRVDQKMDRQIEISKQSSQYANQYNHELANLRNDMGHLRADYTSFHGSINNISSTSSSIMDAIKMLQSQLASAVIFQEKPAKDNSQEGNTDDMLPIIQELCHAVDYMEYLQDDTGTEEILGMIQKLLLGLKKLRRQGVGWDRWTCRRKGATQVWSDEQFEKDVRIIQRLALASGEVEINKPSEYTQIHTHYVQISGPTNQ